MVGDGREAGGNEVRRRLLGGLARQAVDDALAALEALEDGQELPLRAVLLQHCEADVRPIEAVDEDPGLAVGEELALDVVPGHPVGGGGEAGDPGLWIASRQGCQIAVVGAEIVAPLADAMHLVDDDLAELQPVERRLQSLGAEQLGREVEELQGAVLDLLPDPRPLAPIDAAMHGRSGDTQEPELGHLVVHERDQRRDDQGEARLHHRRQLVAEALAAAGGHHGQEVLAGEQGVDDLALPGAKALEAEHPLERFVDGVVIGLDR